MAAHWVRSVHPLWGHLLLFCPTYNLMLLQPVTPLQERTQKQTKRSPEFQPPTLSPPTRATLSEPSSETYVGHGCSALCPLPSFSPPSAPPDLRTAPPLPFPPKTGHSPGFSGVRLCTSGGGDSGFFNKAQRHEDTGLGPFPPDLSPGSLRLLHLHGHHWDVSRCDC